jgi:DNA-binding NtrC family response regulator
MIVAEPGAGVDIAIAQYHQQAGGGPLAEVEAPRLDAAASGRWWKGDGDDAPGAAAAHGGTLVVHDVAGLDPAGQQAVAQILAAGELGRSPVEARVVVTCDPDDVEAMRAAVTAGNFRDDLWRRIQHRIDLPPLRQCCEEIPHWVMQRVKEVAPDLAVHSTLIESCLLRPWPGNVDELRHEIGAAASSARDAGKRTVRGEHLDMDAGMLIAMAGGPPTLTPSLVETARLKRSRIKNPLDDGGVRAALEHAHGDLGRAAIALGVHRNRLRRFIAEHEHLHVLVAGEDIYRTAVVTDED